MITLITFAYMLQGYCSNIIFKIDSYESKMQQIKGLPEGDIA